MTTLNVLSVHAGPLTTVLFLLDYGGLLTWRGYFHGFSSPRCSFVISSLRECRKGIGAKPHKHDCFCFYGPGLSSCSFHQWAGHLWSPTVWAYGQLLLCCSGRL